MFFANMNQLPNLADVYPSLDADDSAAIRSRMAALVRLPEVRAFLVRLALGAVPAVPRLILSAYAERIVEAATSTLATWIEGNAAFSVSAFDGSDVRAQIAKLLRVPHVRAFIVNAGVRALPRFLRTILGGYAERIVEAATDALADWFDPAGSNPVIPAA